MLKNYKKFLENKQLPFTSDIRERYGTITLIPLNVVSPNLPAEPFSAPNVELNYNAC